MKSAVIDLFKSKKFLMGLVAILVWIVGKVGLDVDAPIIEGVVSLIALVITGQAMADIGKERARILVDAAKAVEADEDPLG